MRPARKRLYIRGVLFKGEDAMANTRHHPILDYLRRVLGEPAGGVGDADLLHRFVSERDQAAFELLLWRHAAMVLHVCRQVLGDVDAADDAFQATFLVFVRKAGSISRRESLGSWLYRVAYRIALKARVRLQIRSAAPEELDRLTAPAEAEDAEQRELRRIVCEEVNRLPANYRAAVVACFFEGKTHEEAAKHLGWPRGTVAGRLARARALLHRRLLRRGITLTMGALVAALTVRTAQAALAGLVDSVIHTARLLAAGQATTAVVSPHVATLAKGALQAMYWTKAKIAVIVLFLTGLGGVGVSLLATQEQDQPAMQRKAASAPQRFQPPVAEDLQAQPPQASDDEDEAAEEQPPEDPSPQNAAKLAHDIARSRLDLHNLAIAMHNYAEAHQGQLPLAATVGRHGRALLSWRVELLPYLGEQSLYKQFKRDEPWDSPNNRKLLSKMPAYFAPPGVKTRQPYSTYYQVFVSVGPFAGGGMAGGMGAGMMPGMPGGASGAPSAGGMQGMSPQGMPGGGGQPPAGGMRGGRPGGMPGMPGQGGGPGAGMVPPGMGMGMAAPEEIQHFATPFVKGEVTRFPASIPDGTSNTILIVEAGNPVPWTKPEDLRYADDEPLPELGGLFPNVFHAAFADGSVHTLTKNYNKKQLRNAITANGGEVLDLSKIEARSRPRAGAGDRATVETWQRKNSELRKELELLRQQIRLLKEEQEVERELAGEDPRVRKLKEEHDHMQAELKKLRGESESLKKDFRPPRKRRIEEEEEQLKK
jgi:RNA polymerase sigma factor (sigma-70 family)